jgi:hypothetical protein
MKRFLTAAAILGACAMSASAAIIAQWTFESPNTPPDAADSTASGPHTATATISPSVSGTANGLHAGALTDWTSPAGNGSADSWSVNTWAVGDYFQFRAASLNPGLYLLQITSVDWHQTGSGTGPRDFELQSSTDGVNFTSLMSYQVLLNGSPNLSWSVANGVQAAYVVSHTLATPINDDVVYFRLRNSSTAAINVGQTVASTGTDRVDNFTINGNLIEVPEPSTIAFLGLAGLLGALRRRRA